MSAPAQVWTTRTLLAWMTEAFTRKGLDSPRLSAEILLSHVLKAQRLKLYTEPDREAAGFELEALRGLVARALKHEPIQYLTGEAWFFGLPFAVDRRVLIPRPATETLVEEALQAARRDRQTARTSPDAPPAPQTQAELLATGDEPLPANTQPAAAHTLSHTIVPGGEPSRPAPIMPLLKKNAGRAVGEGLLIADVCTGSGCMAVALLKNLPGARALASDRSTDALAVTLANAATHAVADRLELLEGDLLHPVAERLPSLGVEGLDILVSNPPYIPDHEWDEVAPNVRDHEPTMALRAGPDGLEFVMPILRDGPALLKPGGLLLIELAACTAQTVLQAAQTHPKLEQACILKDHEGLDRVLRARRRA